MTLPNVQDVTVHDAGGDVDTKNVHVTVKGTGTIFRICGFSTERACLAERFGANPDNCDVEMVEISDGTDSRGGWQTANADDGAVYVALTTWLRIRGHEPVASMSGYF
ncbi:hypothetical protein G3A43_07110 [Paraburkholderia aspalathi]|nr:hypothetical protein [Paraburkholderia aspalathi]MBK3780021.1 hypothetical protein [Paraburkholderia aspalathi]